MDACADAAAGMSTKHTRAQSPFRTRTGFSFAESGARPDRLGRADSETGATGGQYTRSGVSRF
jgi:hypothetical protein